MIIATIITASSSAGCTILIDGETTATTKKYKRISSYSPAVGDRVLVAEIAGSYVIIGKVV